MKAQELNTTENQNKPLPELLTVAEVAKVLNVARQTIYNKVFNKEIEYYKVFDTVKFDREYIQGLIQQSKVKSKDQIKQQAGY